MQAALRVCLLLAAFWQCTPLKILVYSPKFGVSHVTTMGRIADVLAEAGHEVTTLMPKIEPLRTEGTKLSKMIYVETAEETAAWVAEKEENMIGVAWNASNKNPLHLINMFTKLQAAFAAQCQQTFATPGLMEQLRAEKFDFALAEPMDMCGYSIFHHIGVDKYALSLTTTISDTLVEVVGGATASSYVPNMLSSYSDKMTFRERVGNFISNIIMKHFMSYFKKAQDDCNAKMGLKDVPNAVDQLALASLVFVNSDPLIEYPRPTLHKIIDIGGISVPPKNSKPLGDHWERILSLREKTVLVSFGSVALSHLMPPAYKDSLKQTFKRFPNVTFIWKYEKEEDKIAEGIVNVVTSTWVPQQQMLGDPRLSVFLTHGGMGSTNEAINRGIPVVAIPIHGDQMRNGKLLERIGSGVNLNKEDLANPDVLEDAIWKVLYDESYTTNARRTAEMLADKPFSPEELLVKNVEFAATFGPLTQLDPYGRHLSFIQYHMLDVIGAIVAVVAIVLYIVFLVLRSLSRCCFVTKKIKNE